MRVEFVSRENAPERLVAEAAVIFEEGPLQGMKLVGLSLWQSVDGEVYVTFPSRASGSGNERRYFEYLRSTNGEAEAIRRVKSWILETYRTQERDEAPAAVAR